jgi:hypothetical protein
MEIEKKSHGALIGSIIIIVILVIGGIYVWQQKTKNDEKLKLLQQEQTMQNSSDELNTLDQEINSTDSTVDANVDAVQ